MRYPLVLGTLDPSNELMANVMARLLAMAKDYGMHEPECPARLIEKAQRGTGAYLVPQPCTCWLAD